MKRINNIQELEYEKLRLRIRQLELEKQMNHSWKRLSRNLTSDLFTEGQTSSQGNIRFKTGNTLLSGALNYGALFLSHRLGMIAGKKIEGLAEQALEKLSQKISSVVLRRKTAKNH
jgi:hypothetical protein